MSIKTIEELQEKITEIYGVESTYELVRQWSIFLQKMDISLRLLVTSLSLGSSEHKEVLEAIISQFKGLKVPEKPAQKLDMNFDFENMSINEIVLSLLYYEKFMEERYIDIYLNTEESFVRENYSGNTLTFYWLFRSLLLDERNHETMILDFFKNYKQAVR
ncbi:MAG: hypothetical protein QXV94_04745 [Thermoplasmata archaeon]